MLTKYPGEETERFLSCIFSVQNPRLPLLPRCLWMFGWIYCDDDSICPQHTRVTTTHPKALEQLLNRPGPIIAPFGVAEVGRNKTKQNEGVVFTHSQ